MTTLQPGDTAPDFCGIDENGHPICLKDFAGKKLVLYFYPQDNTPTCTVQACNLRDNFALLAQHHINIIGISPDEVAKHQKFKVKFELPFPLIADTSHAIITQYGVWGEKQLYGRKYMGLHRTTFLIDEAGKIKAIIAKPKSKEHAAEILKAWV